MEIDQTEFMVSISHFELYMKHFCKAKSGDPYPVYKAKSRFETTLQKRPFKKVGIELQVLDTW